MYQKPLAYRQTRQLANSDHTGDDQSSWANLSAVDFDAASRSLSSTICSRPWMAAKAGSASSCRSKEAQGNKHEATQHNREWPSLLSTSSRLAQRSQSLRATTAKYASDRVGDAVGSVCYVSSWTARYTSAHSRSYGAQSLDRGHHHTMLSRFRMLLAWTHRAQTNRLRSSSVWLASILHLLKSRIVKS